jgi:hypothetical protein
MSVIKIVSGGQTGADRAALDWALAHGISCGGWCPKGRKAEDGRIDAKYPLTESPSVSYLQRTEWNVRDSDGTVLFSIDPILSGGSKKTGEFATMYRKPRLQLHAGEQDAARKLREFLARNPVTSLNVAGPRASEEPAVAEFVTQVLEGGLAHYPCSLPLDAWTWDPTRGLVVHHPTRGGVVHHYNVYLMPHYSDILTTISRLTLVCGLALSQVVEPTNFLNGEAYGMPYLPAEGFSLKSIEREKLDDQTITQGLEELGPDWLGRYHHRSDKPAGLELHLSRCWRTAKYLGVAPFRLTQVVLTHELAHFVSHIGTGGNRYAHWESFAGASRACKEHVAQIASWGLFAVFGRSDLIAVLQ